MRALLCKEHGPASKLVVEEVDDPTPGKGELLIQVAAAGLNFPDTLIIQGKYQMQPPMPFSPGGEAAGTVIAVGEGVKRIQVGQRVIALCMVGAFAEKLVAPELAVVPMPDEMDFETAAGFTLTYATSYYALKQRAKLQAGESLLVLGAAGGVGLAAVELGRVMGAEVIAAASTDEKLAATKEAGATHLLNYSKDDVKKTVKELTEGRGVNVVYDPVGGELSEQSLRATAWDGRFLVIGFASGDIPKIPLNLPLLKGLHIVGVFWGSWLTQFPKESMGNMMELFTFYKEGKIKPKVTQTYTLDQYEEAFGVLTGRRAIGKVVFKVS
ncbi:MAG: NADPH:quinone oxidoreductase family protein [Gammaproteobacteria bacterium]